MQPNDPISASVIIPAYNAASSVAQAIDSVLQHTDRSCEILVIDDASKDATATVVTQMAGQDARVRLLRQTVNRGPAAARNRGLDEARGTWIALLDADDRFAPHRLDRLVAIAEDRAADVVADNLLLCPVDGSGPCESMLSQAVLSAPRWMSAAEFVAGNIGNRRTPRISYGFLHPVMRRDFLLRNGLRYDERNRFGEDFMLYVACLLKGANWWLTPEATYLYSVRFGSLTDVQSAADLLRIRTMEEQLLHDDPGVAGDPALTDALWRHRAVINRFYYYRAFTDALKAKAIPRAMCLLLESANGCRDILLESLVQGPRVALKALRGGYRARSFHVVPSGTSRARSS